MTNGLHEERKKEVFMMEGERDGRTINFYQ